MATMILRNKEKTEWVWIDARLSNGDKSFSDLPNVAGFPRWIEQGSEVKFDTQNATELLYRRSLEFAEPSQETLLLSELNRVNINPKHKEAIGYIWPRSSQLCFPTDKEQIPFHNRESLNSDEINNYRNTIISKNRKIRNYEIESLITTRIVEPDNFLFFQVSVKLRHIKSGKTGEYMLLEASPWVATDLIAKYSIKNKCLIALPSSKKYSLASIYRSFGFKVPIMVPIDEILES